MKIEKNFATGLFSGILGSLLLVILTATTTRVTTPLTPIYEFYDSGEKSGMVFNTVTGEIKYEEIRETPIQSVQKIKLTNWNGSNRIGFDQTQFFD